MDEILRIVVIGRVQGVGYRFFTEALARRLGLAGWVRNLPAGDVEIVARVEGRREAEFLAELRRGPPMARVTGLKVEPASRHMTCPASGFTTRF